MKKLIFDIVNGILVEVTFDFTIDLLRFKRHYKRLTNKTNGVESIKVIEVKV